MMIPWSELFGPRRFLQSVREDLREGACVVVALPRIHPPNIVATLERCLLQQTPLAVTLLRPEPGSLAAEAIYRGCRLPRPDSALNARSLAECAAFRNCVALVDISEEVDPEPWLAFIHRYGDLIRNRAVGDRGLVCLVVYEERGEPPSEGPALRVRRWRGVVSGLDVRTLVRGSWAERTEGPSGIREHLREVLIAELSGGDLELASHLNDREFDELLSPHALLRDYAERRSWAPEHPPNLTHGSAEIVDGRTRTHSARLAMDRERERELQVLLWRAGVQVLFPFLEDERRAAISRWRARLDASLRDTPLQTATGRVISGADELEVSHLADRLKGVGGPAEMCEWMRLLADVRNDLAHLRPVSTARLHRLLEVAPRVSLSEGK